jgi:hypothetical protein
MEIEQVREKSNILRKNIDKLLTDYTNETGMEVTGINVFSVMKTGFNTVLSYIIELDQKFQEK